MRHLDLELLRVALLVGLLAGGLLLAPGCETTSQFIAADGSLDCQVLYARRCSQCHALYQPDDFSDEEWVQKVKRYGPRAGIHPEWRPQLIEWLQRANDRPAGG
ncbi:MAG: hypothetical protein CMJ83_11640 [Planctomycetes bacterium]|nr:hypothetical protein [Planctomycetota bacterium]